MRIIFEARVLMILNLITIFRALLRLAFIAAVVFLFFTACKAHKNCGDPKGKDRKYISKRYKKALHERDSLCNVTHVQQNDLSMLRNEMNSLSQQHKELNERFSEYQKTSGSQLNKLNTDLDKNQATLRQREERLMQLESILRRQDSLLNRLHNSVKNALLGFTSDELSVEMKNGKVYISLSDKLLFKSGNANVEAKGREALKKVAEVLNKNNDVSIAIEGHTDNVPIKTALYKDNWDLSTARATNVVRLLTNEYGMDATKLSAVGKAEFFPVADNSTPEGKARNRRTEIVLSPNLEELMKLIDTKY
jgi:chemotaxis protein MotB